MINQPFVMALLALFTFCLLALTAPPVSVGCRAPFIRFSDSAVASLNAPIVRIIQVSTLLIRGLIARGGAFTEAILTFRGAFVSLIMFCPNFP